MGCTQTVTATTTWECDFCNRAKETTSPRVGEIGLPPGTWFWVDVRFASGGIPPFKPAGELLACGPCGRNVNAKILEIVDELANRP